MIMVMLSCAAFFMFMVRFCERRFPRLERALLVGYLLAVAWLLLTEDFATTRIVLSMLCVALYLASCIIFIVVTRKVRRVDVITLNIVNIVVLLGIVHDMLLLAGILHGTLYFSPITTQLRVVSMAFVLAWHFVASLTRIERFNQELVDKITAARQELALTLHEQHELALSNTRQGERMSLLHNLHDGLGGTLVNNIAMLERKPDRFGSDRFLSILKELREELRIVVDTTTGQDNEQDLAEWLAPLRSRYVLLCENRDIVCDWKLEGLENRHLPPRYSLELMRMLQESLTNALKHAEPRTIRITLRVEDKSLLMRVEDDGRGFDIEKIASGTGLQSLKTRTQRLDGKLCIESRPGATVIAATIPLQV
jgi:signal transduction histidine kinase